MVFSHRNSFSCGLVDIDSVIVSPPQPHTKVVSYRVTIVFGDWSSIKLVELLLQLQWSRLLLVGQVYPGTNVIKLSYTSSLAE